MSLRDDVRWVCDAADGLLIGWLPGRLPKWATKEEEKLGWLVLLLWRKFYDASMARIRLEAEVARLSGDVDGLRATNERLTDILDEPQREAAAAALASEHRRPGYYWVRVVAATLPTVSYWNGNMWRLAGPDPAGAKQEDVRVLAGPLRQPNTATQP